MEKYLCEMKNCDIRVKYTKFRLSNHNLMIEKGRHMGMKSAERMCPFCMDKVEDELHFLLDCHVYNQIRGLLLREVGVRSYFFKYFRREHKFKYLMTNFSSEVADVIYKCFELRDFLLSSPKRCE